MLFYDSNFSKYTKSAKIRSPWELIILQYCPSVLVHTLVLLLIEYFASEAEYVYRLRKDFVPLRLQREYIPDGWLGILVGTRLYFDVYSEDQLDVQVPRLIKELRDRGKISPTLDQPDHSKLPVGLSHGLTY